MRRIHVNVIDLESAMEIAGFEGGEEQIAYLDLESGEVILVWESDEEFESTTNAVPEENRRNAEAVEANPDRYAELPELDSFDANEMLQEFLDSSWTDDAKLRSRARDAYRGSIGRWKKAIGRDPRIIHPWNAYEERARLQRIADHFREEHGVELVIDDEVRSAEAAGPER